MKLNQLSFITVLMCTILVSPLFAGAVNPAPMTQTVGISSPPPPAAPFDNVILMIGDGMSWGQINATKKWLGSSANLTLEELTHLGDIDTYCLNNPVTDSAAAATALATGNMTNANMVSMTPTGVRLTTILEAAEALGKSTGLVTTTPLTHGTPGPFSAHVPHRADQDEIAHQQIYQGIEVLLGGGMGWYSPYLGTATSLGYYIAQNRAEMATAVTEDYLLGLFATGDMPYNYDRNPAVDPHIAEMTNISLQILDRNTEGFFLMVEGGRIDHACHDWNINRTIGETLAFDEAVQIAYNFTQTHDRTLLIVTADHETGGLWVNMTNPVLEYQFTATYHTATPVPVFVYHNTSAILPTFNHLTDLGKYLFEAFDLVPGHMPLEWTDAPTDQVVEFGDSCTYQLDVFSVATIDSWWVNDTANFNINQNGLIQNKTNLIVGNYGLEVFVNDSTGLVISASFSFHIQDTTAPSWVTIPQNQQLEVGTAFTYRLQAFDLSGISQWLINDTIHFAIDSTGEITSILTLSQGTYGLNVTASDPYGNILTATFSVTVQDSSQPPPPPPITPGIPGFPFAAILLALAFTISLTLIIRRKTNTSA